MKDITRIVKVCGEIAVEWENKCPFLTFMELINNFMRWLGNDGLALSDEEFIKLFKQYTSYEKGE